ncbi:MAG: serine protein kinase RIO [Candidatus Bathyarchaeia archaeon]
MRRSKMDRAERKVTLEERRYIVEQLMKHKRSEEWEVLEEVFDKPTLLNLYQLLNRRALARVHGVVKAGKESRIYWGETPDGREAAIKIYLTVSSEFKKGMLSYILGDPRFPRVRRDARTLIQLWARKEYKNLSAAYKAGVRVPEPLTVKGNILVMEFIGEKGVPAPLLREASNLRMEEAYRKILGMVRALYDGAGLVHADLSEYNVMIWRGEPVFIDLSQAVHRDHPSAEPYLRRDLENLNKFFSRRGVEVVDAGELTRWVMGGHE